MPASQAHDRNEVNVRKVYLDDDDVFPNSTLPVLVYAGAVDPNSEDLAAVFEHRFSANAWPPAWRNGIYGIHQYHSKAHEVLGICRGEARVQMGGPSGPTLEVKAGDAVVIPAGVAHRNLGASNDFLVVGAYPQGQTWDMNRGQSGERPRADKNMRAVPLPTADPVLGDDGLLTLVWH